MSHPIVSNPLPRKPPGPQLTKCLELKDELQDLVSAWAESNRLGPLYEHVPDKGYHLINEPLMSSLPQATRGRVYRGTILNLFQIYFRLNGLYTKQGYNWDKLLEEHLSGTANSIGLDTSKPLKFSDLQKIVTHNSQSIDADITLSKEYDYVLNCLLYYKELEFN
jgi:hypothetical protein